MNIAKCVLDNKVYTAHEFLKGENLHVKRRHLVCNECGNPAYFVKPSKNGRFACFGARPHKDSCTLRSPEHEQSLGVLEDIEKELMNSGDEIKVDFTIGSHGNSFHVSDSGMAKNEKQGKNHSRKNGVGTAYPTRRLSSFLNMLMHSEDFAKSTQKINVGHKYPYYAKNLFKKFEDLGDKDNAKFRGVYGQIYDVNFTSNEAIWINSGGFADCSILIPASLKESLLKYFKISLQELDNITGKYVLCFGNIIKSGQGKFYVKLDDISKIMFK